MIDNCRHGCMYLLSNNISILDDRSSMVTLLVGFNLLVRSTPLSLSRGMAWYADYCSRSIACLDVGMVSRREQSIVYLTQELIEAWHFQ